MNPETNRELTPDEDLVLARVLDEMIPPSDDGRLPGAGELGLAGAVDAALRPLPEIRAMTTAGLAALEEIARRRHGCGFASLSRERRAEAMDALAVSEHALPPVLLMQVYGAYYQHPRVLETLGLEARPPHPRGYDMGDDDLSLLDPVRRRAPFYRRP